MTDDALERRVAALERLVADLVQPTPLDEREEIRRIAQEFQRGNKGPLKARQKRYRELAKLGAKAGAAS